MQDSISLIQQHLERMLWVISARLLLIANGFQQIQTSKSPFSIIGKSKDSDIPMQEFKMPTFAYQTYIT